MNFDGMPQFDEPSETAMRARATRAARLRAVDFSVVGALRPQIVDDPIAKRTAELRDMYRGELERLTLMFHRPGMQRVYADAEKREYLVDRDGLRLAALWVDWPDPGEYIVVIRSEVYGMPLIEPMQGQHGRA